MLRGASTLVMWALLAATAAGCAKARAASVPDGPPLQVPEPPQRVLAPVEDPLLATTPPPAAEPDPPVATASPPRTPSARPAPEPKPAPPAASPPAAVVDPPRAPVETRELRPASPTTAAATERGVRDLLVRAARDLGRVDYGRLSADGRAQYEQSRRFSTQAEEALQERNLVFAATLADKAATLAAELLKR